MDMGVSIDIWNKVLYIVKLNWYWIICCFISSGPRHLMLVFLTILLNLLVLSVFVVPEKYVYSMNIDNYYFYCCLSFSRTVNATGSAPNFILFPMVPNWYYPILLPILGGLHIILSLWMYLEFMVKEWPNFTKTVFFISAAKSVGYVVS